MELSSQWEAVMFWVNEEDIKEFAEHSGLPEEASKQVLEGASGSLEDIKEKWTKVSDKVNKQHKKQKKLADKIDAALKDIPALLEKPNIKKLAEAILMQQELIQLYRKQNQNRAIEMVDNVARNFGISVD